MSVIYTGLTLLVRQWKKKSYTIEIVLEKNGFVETMDARQYLYHGFKGRRA